MITEIEGCILNAFDRGIVEAIAHQANVEGKMGAGIAKEIAARYPSALRDVRAFTNPKFGQVLITQLNDSQIIFHIFAQSLFSKSECKTDYEALSNGLKLVLRTCRRANVTHIGIPAYIGCGLGGGDWKIVRKIIENVFGKDETVNLTIFEKRV